MINENNLVRAVSRWSWRLLGAMTVVSALAASPRFAAGVLAGGLIAIGNFYWMQSVLRRILHLPAGKAAALVQLRYVLRLAIIAALIYLLVVVVGLDIIGLIIGLSVLVLVIAGISIFLTVLKGG